MITEKAGLWVRVSSGGQDEANQVPDVERHAASLGYDVKRTYTVHGKSASKGHHQKDLDAMLADMRAGVIKVLVIWHSSRIERRPGKALLDLLEEVATAGGRVESVLEPMLGQLDFGSQVTTFMAGLMNAEKSRVISEGVGMAHDRIRVNEAMNGRPVFGYEVVGEKYNKRLVLTPIGRKYIPEIFQRCIAGQSCRTIALWLTAEGVPTNSKIAQEWSDQSVGQMIRNPVYMGYRQDANGKVTHRCEAVVDADVFRRAGEAIDRRPKRGPVSPANGAMLAGSLFCPMCGGPMYRVLSERRTGVKVPFYRCRGKAPAGGGGVRRSECKNMVEVAVLDAIVSARIERWDTPIMKTVVIPGHNHEAELKDIAFQLEGLGHQGLSREELRRKQDELWAEEDRLTALPVVEDEPRQIDTGRTYAGDWAKELDDPGRAAWLKAEKIRIFAMNQKIYDAAGADIESLERDDYWGPLHEDDHPLIENGACVWLNNLQALKWSRLQD